MYESRVTFEHDETVSPHPTATESLFASLHSPLPGGSFQCQSKFDVVTRGGRGKERTCGNIPLFFSATSTSDVAAASMSASHFHAKTENMYNDQSLISEYSLNSILVDVVSKLK